MVGSAMRLSVVIPQFNGKHLLPQLLNSLKAALSNVSGTHEMIISDDASTDGSVEEIKEHWPEVLLVESQVNTGFGPTVNRGAQVATGDLLMVLNNDVMVRPDYFSYSMAHFSKPDVFGVMGSIENHEGRIIDASKWPARRALTVVTTKNFQPRPDIEAVQTFFLSGANALISREKYMRLGGYSDWYAPFYMEDVDLSVRAWRKGWKCIYEARSVCTHQPSTTIARFHKPGQIRLISRRNRLIFHASHLDGVWRFLWVLSQGVQLLTRWIVLDWNFYRAYFLFFQKLPEVLKSRLWREAKPFSKLFRELKVECGRSCKELF